MELESGDGKDPSSSPSHGAKEDSDLYKTNGTTPTELEYSFLIPREDADDDTTLFSKTSSKSSQLEEQYKPDYATYGPDYSNTWEGELRAVTQTQIDAFKNSTELELRAVLAKVAKDIKDITLKKAEYRGGSINGFSRISHVPVRKNSSPAGLFIYAEIE
jgi:hypothetical protein